VSGKVLIETKLASICLVSKTSPRTPAEAARRNILSGAIWSPFIHLSANLVQTRYDISETLASRFAAILLCGAIVLYPIVSHEVTTHTLKLPVPDSNRLH
jgi:hypothetical protein